MGFSVLRPLLTRQFIPAAFAAVSPMYESSITTTRSGSSPMVSWSRDKIHTPREKKVYIGAQGGKEGEREVQR